MDLQSLENWQPVSKVPALTGGRITRTMARRLFAERAESGLEQSGGARMIGRSGYVNVPALLDRLFGPEQG